MKSTTNPRYQQIATELRAQIARGKYAVGSLLPTEIEICAIYKVSRHTAREALRILTEEGLVERYQGHGTRVVASEPHAFQRSISSIADLMQYGANTHLTAMKTSRLVADAEIAALLQCDVGTRCVHVHCLRSERHAKVPFCVTDVYRIDAADALTKRMASLKDAVLAIVETLSVKHIGRVEQRISASRLDPASARSLRTPAKEPCLLIVRRHFDYKGKLILAAVNQHRAVDYVYAMELKRSK